MHETGPPLRRRRLTDASGILASILFLSAAYCYACPPPDEDPEPDLSGVYVVPQEVWVAAGSDFTLAARVLDASGNVTPDAELATLEWRSEPALFPPVSGPTVSVKTTIPGPFPKTFTIKASLSGMQSAPAHVYVTDGNLTDNMDRVTTTHVSGDPPALVLVDGRTTRLLSDTLVAVVGTGAIDYLTCPSSEPTCGEVTLFSRAQQAHREAALALTGVCDAVGLSGAATFPPGCRTTMNPVGAPRSAKVAIYILASEAIPAPTSNEDEAAATVINPTTAVEMDLAHAKKVLADGMTGISLSSTITDNPFGQTLITLGERHSCTSGDRTVRGQLIDAGVPSGLMGGRTIVVAYVSKILLADGSDLSGVNGGTCPWADSTGSIVLVSWSEWSATTLAHELVHALGPWFEYPWGHVNEVDGLTSQNIMWESEDATYPAPRSLLTLGQAFRLSLDANSIFHRTLPASHPTGTFLCQGITSSAEAPCPRLTKDVVRR
jgi:hypothetical protein